MDYNKKNKSIQAYILTAIYPIAGLLISLCNYKQKYAKNVFWILCSFIGLVFIYDPEGGTGSDCERYASWLIEMHNKGVSFNTLQQLFFTEYLDLYQPLVTFIVSIFTSNPTVLFFIFAIVFGYFYSRNIWFVLDKTNNKLSLSAWVIVIALLLVCPIWYINGVRMWTATQVFIYGLLPFIIEKDKSKLFWCYASLLFHFSFLFPAVLLSFLILLPFNTNIAITIYVLSQMVSSLNLVTINGFLNGLGFGMYEKRINSYANENYADILSIAKAQQSAYLSLFESVYKYSFFLMTLITYFYLKKIRQDKWLLRFFCYTLLFVSAFNVVSNIPSGIRFTTISTFLLLTLFLLFKDKFHIQKYNFFLNIFSLMLITQILLNIRKGAYSLGIDVFFQNFITVFFIENNITIDHYIEYFKSI